MARPDVNSPVKPYFSRRGETMDEFVDGIFSGKVTILSEVPGGTDTVLIAGLDAARKKAQSSGKFLQVSHQVYGTMPSEITPKTVQLVADAIQDAFRESSSSQASLRIPIFTIEALHGQLALLQETFLQLVYYNMRSGPEVRRGRVSDSLLKVSPIIQVLDPKLDQKLFKKIKAKLTPGKDTDEVGPEVVNFDIRTFDREHLVALLQPEFPDEDLTTNPDFDTLLEKHGGNARLSLFIRSYARKGTIDLINGDIEPVEIDPESEGSERKWTYRPLGPRPTFSRVFEALTGQGCHLDEMSNAEGGFQETGDAGRELG